VREAMQAALSEPREWPSTPQVTPAGSVPPGGWQVKAATRVEAWASAWMTALSRGRTWSGTHLATASRVCRDGLVWAWVMVRVVLPWGWRRRGPLLAAAGGGLLLGLLTLFGGLWVGTFVSIAGGFWLTLQLALYLAPPPRVMPPKSRLFLPEE